MAKGSNTQRAAAAPEAARPPRLQILVGTDAWLRRRAVETKRFEWLESADEVQQFDLGECALADVLQAAQSLPMFAARQVLVCHGLACLKASEHGALLRYAQSPAPSTLLLMPVDKLDQRLTLSRALAKLGCIEALVSPPRATLPSWLVAEASARGARLSPQVAAAIVARVGDGLALLIESIDKLQLYAGEGQAIELTHVAALIAPTRAASIFALTDALGGGSWPAASKALTTLLDDGEQPLVILSMLIRQVRLLLAAQQGAQLNVPPHVRQGLVRQARRLARPALRATLIALQRADADLKGSRLPALITLERAIWPLLTSHSTVGRLA